MIRGDGGFTEGMLFVLFFNQGGCHPPTTPVNSCPAYAHQCQIYLTKNKITKMLNTFFKGYLYDRIKKMVSIQIPPRNSQFIVFHNSDLFSELQDINLLFWEEHSELWDINSQLQEIKSDLLDKKLQLHFLFDGGKLWKIVSLYLAMLTFFSEFQVYISQFWKKVRIKI